MPIELARWRAALTVFGFVLTMQSAAAFHRVPNHRQADNIVRSRHVAARPPVHHDDIPDYNDPSKFGGSTAPSTMAESPSAPPPVHVQPRGGAFNPNSDGVKAVQKRITDFDEMQRIQDQSFDRKLLICRGC
jgi:hypothetical protein